jgi:hypothetical protein
MKIRIESDGTSVGTKVTDLDGKLIGYVQEITWKTTLTEPLATCTITIAKVPVDLVVESPNFITKEL